MKTENELADIATFHEDDIVANAAMKELRERFDPTYFFCVDCDGIATSEKDCCMNRIIDNSDDFLLELT